MLDKCYLHHSSVSYEDNLELGSVEEVYGGGSRLQEGDWWVQ